MEEVKLIESGLSPLMRESNRCEFANRSVQDQAAVDVQGIAQLKQFCCALSQPLL